MEPLRETFFEIPPTFQLAIYVIAAVAFLIIVVGILRRVQIWKMGVPEKRTDHLSTRFKLLLKVGALLSKTIEGDKIAGSLHGMIYTGIIVLTIGTTLVAIDYDTSFKFLRGTAYLVFELSLDIFGIILIGGVLVAILRRFIWKPTKLHSNEIDVSILATFLIVAFSGFIVEGLRLATSSPPWATWSPFGFALMLAFNSPPSVFTYQYFWLFHIATVFALAALLPFTKLMHLVTSPLNIFFSSLKPRGVLPLPFNMAAKPANEIAIERPDSFGIKTVTDLSWKQLLSLDACTECGRCQEVCPASQTGKKLSPKWVIINLRNHAHDRHANEKQLAGPVVSEEELWDCTTCGACVEVCPVLIDHVDIIVGLRRDLVYESQVTADMSKVLSRTASYGNPWGAPYTRRTEWAEGLGVPLMKDNPGEIDVLYWVGCQATFDPRAQEVAKATAKILKAAGVRFAILGPEEKCTGDFPRRFGDEGLFQSLAVENMKTLKKYGVRKIIVHCPHCLNTLKNEYEQLGLNLEVLHHSQFIRELITKGRIKLAENIQESVTFHDPCYLGRYNGIFNPPREVIGSIRGYRLVEMKNCRQNSLCCGAGGGRVWLSQEKGQRINGLRVSQAKETGCSTVATGCPFCLVMLEEGKTVEGAAESLRIRDISELVASNMI